MKIGGWGRDFWSRPMLLLLLVVIVPTIGMLWFMLAAIDNEHVAVRQRLITAYRAQLIGVKTQLAARLQQAATELDSRVVSASCASLFADVVRAGQADSLICAAEGSEYPAWQKVPSAPGTRDDDQTEALRFERRGEYDEAARAYSAIARAATDAHVAARALQARARCLRKDDNLDAAIEVLSRELAQPRYRSARDGQGRLITPSAQLLALQLIENPDDATFRAVADSLYSRLSDYDDPVVPAPQRRFLMSELRRIDPTVPAFDTQAAEDLAAGFLGSDTPPAEPSRLTRSGPDGIWQLPSPSGKVVALHTEDSLRERLMGTVAAAGLSAETTVDLLLPGEGLGSATVFVTFAEEESLPGWRLVLQFDERALVDEGARRQIAVYVWTGVLVILLIFAGAGWIAGAVRRQLRETQLKNDLLATVSHELKTPLASMRLLVETLLDEDRHQDWKHTREYLDLIFQENHRLSRLVDNFLSYSRMERDKQKFERVEISAADVARAAESAAADRLSTPGCTFDMEIAPDLPPIHADLDAMVTVILNLLDNAHKYTGDDKRITLRVYAKGDEVCFAVRDNGIGMSGRVRSKIFERFYQVDQSLSRRGGGCGLGLSIVRFVVKAHGGRVDVESQTGKGSTFTVRLPAVAERRDAPARQKAMVS